ncbi:SRPBCC domain-containing protein [Leptospira sp. GIMC2001]|uniref:SRPBCC domain-containing protein n=1 Tax=Leptospira sp. GIMC2001 TaxID=1513297 RepID=UPI00234A7F0B|nr:SRPBCC domain-containing protein [Leptospira sp. GIMC2001]WCL49124.1 SRPBCC domain-containing protein [Leptospira sp. GIMC2001]
MNENSKETFDRQISVIREYDAPIEMVFNSWTNSGSLDIWWGPNGFKNSTKSMDFKLGGKWIYTMLAPDGTIYPNCITYTEIIPNQLIRYNHGSEEEISPEDFQVVVKFEKSEKGTRISMTMTLPSKEAKDTAVKFGAVEGANQTLAKLNLFVDSELKT